MKKKYCKRFFITLLGISLFVFVQIYHYPLALRVYSFFQVFKKEELQVDEKDPLTQQIEAFNASFQRQMRDEFDLSVQSRVWCHGDPIESITLNVPTGLPATLAEGRALLICIVERYTEEINRFKELEPYLKEKPFDHRDLGIQIYFKGRDRYIADGTLSSIYKVGGNSSNRNQVFYDSNDPFLDKSVSICQESYEEAKEKNLSTALESFFHKEPTEKEVKIDQVLTSIRREIEIRHRLNCHAIGGDMVDDIHGLGGSFVALYPCSKEKTRKLVVEVAEIFLRRANKSPLFREEPLSISDLKIYISFRKNKRLVGPVSYEGKKSIESVILENGKIHYKKEPEREEGVVRWPVACGTESYEEAVKILRTE